MTISAPATNIEPDQALANPGQVFSADEIARLERLAHDHGVAVVRKMFDRYAADKRFIFDEKAAEQAVTFFPKHISHATGSLAGQPFHLNGWQELLVRLVFGFKWAVSGLRVVRTVYLFVARKNGKSTFAAALTIMMMFLVPPGSQLVGAAANEDQAKIVLTEAAKLIAVSPQLRSRMQVYKTGIEATRANGLATGYQVLSSRPDSKHGLNPAFIVNDEIHAQRSRELYDVLNTSTGAQAEPLEVDITTAGDSRATICWELQTRAEAVEAGALDAPDFLPILFRAAADDDWTDPETWIKANPSLGHAVRLEYLADQCRAAQQTPARENTFRRLHLNQWTEQATRWIPMDKWRACPGADSWRELPAQMAGKRCFAGLDLSTTTDLTAFVLMFPPQPGVERFTVVPKFFAPLENAAIRARRDRVPYPDWGRAGAMVLTAGNVIDYDVVAEAVIDAAGMYRLEKIAFDRYNASMLVNRLMSEGLPMIAMGQGYVSYAAPMREAEGLILDGGIIHGDHPVLSWNAANVAVDMDSAGNMKPAKGRSGDRIDGIAAMLMALAQAQAEQNGGSVYETRGVRVI